MSAVPELLTIEEAARVMRISRNTAYQRAREFRATNGESGLEVVDAGGQMRVPRRRLEEKLQIVIDSIPSPEEPASSDTRNAQTSKPESRPANESSMDTAEGATNNVLKKTVGYLSSSVWNWRVRR